jgi:hypothetical protein
MTVVRELVTRLGFQVDQRGVEQFNRTIIGFKTKFAIAATAATAFVAKGAATFTLSIGNHQRTFLALNDSTNGFSALTDAVIEISGYKGNITNLAIV